MESLDSEKLQSINESARSLIQCESLDELFQKALTEICARLNVQAASIFILSKEGVIERVKIEGVDRNGEVIAQNWLEHEYYEPGESFSGFPVPPMDSNMDYGNPNYVNNILEKYPQMKYGEEYKEKLGRLDGGIAVPLNGLSRTIGTVEVLNKLDKKDFNLEDVYWLLLIGSKLAGIISYETSKEYNKVFKSLIEILVELEPNYINLTHHAMYTAIASKVISDFTPYKVCIIRIPDEEKYLNIKSQVSTKDVSLIGRKDSSIPSKSYMIGKVYDTKKPQFVYNIEDRKKEFFNIEWIKNQKLKSYACLPLIIKDKCVGTISVYTKYNMKFYERDKDILKYFAFLIASISERFRITNELYSVRSKLNDAQEKFLNVSILVGYESQLKNIVHQYKNELIEGTLVLKDLLDDSLSQKDKKHLIKSKLVWLEKRTEEVQSLIRIEDPIPIQVNDLIKQVVNTFSFHSFVKIKEKYCDDIPIIYLNPEKLNSVIHNLISNSLIAIKNNNSKNGEIAITTNTIVAKKIPKIQICIEDNGNGIPAENHSKIYFQGFTTRKDKGGTGMGLYISKLIIEEYGGKIFFESKVGHGTKFFIHIPIKRNQDI